MSVRAPGRDDLPDLDSVDARRAVIDAARHDGLTSCRGAFEATRRILEPNPGMKPGDIEHVVWLTTQDPGTGTLAWYRVRDFRELRDDWARPSPCEPGETVLPEEEYGLSEIFPDVEVLPGTHEEDDS